MTDAPKPFDRGTQRRILEVIRDAYPDSVNGPKPEAFGLESSEALLRELTYLREHGLLDFRNPQYTGSSQVRDIQITAKGIDFLADDGGLGAILGVVTVRLEADTIKALLTKAVDDSGAEPTVKQNLTRQIKALPAEAVREVAVAGVQAALRSAPDAMQWLRTLLAAWVP